jgi:outer membrane protein assembly factor BamB
LNIYNPGETELFLTIESKNVTTYEPQVPGGSGFAFPDALLAAYLTYTAEIANHSLLPAPIVTSVVPNTGDANKIINDVEVHGLNFINGAVVKFKHASSVFAIGPLPASFIDSTLLTIDLNLAGAPPGFYNVTVTNPDTKFGTLDNAFEVTNSMWWQSYMYNAQNIGWNPTANLPDPSALQQKWVTNIGGFKFTTPVVADGKIFFSTNNSYWEYPDMAIHCVDLNTGVELWSKLINPTSASTGARVFSCPVWWHGPDGIDRVAVGGDQVYCFNADTGDPLWSFDDPDSSGTGWWSNQMKEYDGKVLARSRYQPLYVLDFQTGAMLAEIITSNSSEGGCGAANGKVYINSSYNVDCADINTGAILWSTVLPGSGTNMNHWVDPCIVGNRLYVTTYQSICFCISIDSSSGYPPGQVIWSWSDPTMPAMSATMYAGAGARESGGVTRLYISSASGASNAYVYCVEDQGTGASMVWKSAQAGSYEGGAIWSSAPSYPEGVVYVPEVYTGVLYAFNAANGSVVWSYPAGSITAKCGVSLVNNQLVLCSNADVRVFKAP